MATSKIGILIETLYKGQGTKQATKDLEGLDDAAKGSTSNMDKLRAGFGQVALAAGAVGVAVVAAKQVFDFGAEGRKIDIIRSTFETLATSVGSSSAAMLEQVKEATQGMVSETELMTSANRFLSMGIGNTADEVSYLSEMAVKLGSAMGKEAGPAMEEFALLLANRSIPRLDTFGISASNVRTRMEELKDAGLDLDEAFQSAVFEEGAIAMDRLGDSIPVDEFAQFSADWANFVDDLKVGTGAAVGAPLGFLQQVKALDQLLDEMQELGLISAIEDFEVSFRFLTGAEGSAAEIAALTEELEAYHAGIERASEANRFVEKDIEAVGDAASKSVDDLYEFGNAFNEMARNATDAEHDLEGNVELINNFRGAILEAQREAERFRMDNYMERVHAAAEANNAFVISAGNIRREASTPIEFQVNTRGLVIAEEKFDGMFSSLMAYKEMMDAFDDPGIEHEATKNLGDELDGIGKYFDDHGDDFDTWKVNDPDPEGFVAELGGDMEFLGDETDLWAGKNYNSTYEATGLEKIKTDLQEIIDLQKQAGYGGTPGGSGGGGGGTPGGGGGPGGPDQPGAVYPPGSGPGTGSPSVYQTNTFNNVSNAMWVADQMRRNTAEAWGNAMRG